MRTKRNSKWIFHLLWTFSLHAASLQETKEPLTAEQDAADGHTRQLIVNSPCLPCFREQNVGCRRVFGCIVNSDNSISSIFFSLSSLVGSEDSGRKFEDARAAVPAEVSPCLPCHYRDWHDRCRKIRGCVYPVSAEAEVATTFLLESETVSVPEDDVGGEEAASALDTVEGVPVAESGEQLEPTDPSEPFEDRTGVLEESSASESVFSSMDSTTKSPPLDFHSSMCH
nr:uncharacterized protein LOC128690704 [Cherax quadricarinatus]